MNRSATGRGGLRPRRGAAGVLLWMLASLPGLGTEAVAATYAGWPLSEALDQLRAEGLNLIYSDALVRPSMRVLSEPGAGDAQARLAALLAPFGLRAIDGPQGTLLIVRARLSRTAALAGLQPGARQTAGLRLDEVVVNASRYELERQSEPSLESLDAADLARSPDVGDDPLRATARLPGIATRVVSAQIHIRGGGADETLYRFDGVRLYDAFHLKDFMSVFSIIDPATISGLTLYTGGFPVVFGDRLSGVVDLQPLDAPGGASGELSLSLFNVGGSYSRRVDAGRGQLLLAARRSTADWVLRTLQESRSQPTYAESLGRLQWALTDRLQATAGLLAFNDDIVVADSDDEESARASYRDRYFWFRLDAAADTGPSGSVTYSHTALASHRRGSVDQPGVSQGELRDERAFGIDGLQTDWRWPVGGSLLWKFGGEWRAARGAYDYADQASFDLLFRVPGASQERVRTRNLSVRPRGEYHSAHAAMRFKAGRALTAEAGLRWDRDTLVPGRAGYVSPRLAAEYRYPERTAWRLSLGRFHQAQSINELPVSDGVGTYAAAQSMIALVVGVEHELAAGRRLRVEAYHKRYHQPRPRYENLLNPYVLVPELKPDRIAITPTGARARGIEATISSATGRPLEWWLSHVWSRVEDRGLAGTALRAWDQTHAFSGGISHRRGNWEWALALGIHSGWPTTTLRLAEPDPALVEPTDALGDTRVGSFMSIDARAAHHFRFGTAGTLTAFIEIANLSNHRNECCVEYEINADSGALALDTSAIRYPRVVPSVGVLWRF